MHDSGIQASLASKILLCDLFYLPAALAPPEKEREGKKKKKKTKKQKTPKISRRKEIIKIRSEINEIGRAHV